MGINDILFIDIETVPQSANSESALLLGNLFAKRHNKETEGDADKLIEVWEQKAALEAEFGKVVCVSIGKFSGQSFFVRSHYGVDESETLRSLINSFETGSATILGGHNIKGFDIHFLFRRYLINGITPPSIVNLEGKKPWEIPHVDTMEMWANSEWKYRVSLELLCAVLNVPSPKGEFNGSMVADEFYKEGGDLKKIADYCAQDVIAAASCYCRMKGLPIITPEQIKFVQ